MWMVVVVVVVVFLVFPRRAATAGTTVAGDATRVHAATRHCEHATRGGRVRGVLGTVFPGRVVASNTVPGTVALPGYTHYPVQYWYYPGTVPGTGTVQ